MDTILVVDDMPIVREPIAASLRSAGYRTLCASNGKDALELLRNQHPDLVLLDVQMPVMDGLTFLRSVRADPATAGTPVILLTSAEQKEDILRAADIGVQSYLLKSSFSLPELLSRVREQLQRLRGVNGAAPGAAGETSVAAPRSQAGSAVPFASLVMRQFESHFGIPSREAKTSPPPRKK